MEQNKLGNFYILVVNNSHSFIPQILKAVGLLGEKILFCQGFEIQKNNNYKTSKLKFQSFRAFQRYLTDKNPAHGGGTVSGFQFSTRSF